MQCVLCLAFVLLLAVVNGSPECSNYEFPCEDGECIDEGLWCDSHKDCFDGSDEKYCKKTSLWGSKDPNKCPKTYFKCNDGPCIPLSGVCNGFNNCDDNSDEKDCEDPDLYQTIEDTESSTYKTTFRPLEVISTAATNSSITSTTTQQPPLKFEESNAKRFTDSRDAMQHSVQIVYSDFHPSDYMKQRKMARSWLLSQRKADFGWGDETPRALTALYLSSTQESIERNESDMLMVKQLEVQLSLAIARNGTKAMKLTDLALFINALQASCKDPENFYGENMVRTLRNAVNAAQREATFVNPSVYLTLCMNNASTYDDTRKLHDVFVSRNAAIGRMDIQALAMLTSSCVYRSKNFITSPIYDGHRKQFLHRMNISGFPGNVYEASLVAQALQELKVTLPGLYEFILDQQKEDGSFGGILATYLALPVLAGKNFLHLKDHCVQKYATDLAPIEVLKNSKRRKIYVQYSLNYGNPIEVTQTIQMQVAEGLNFLDVMRLAQEINPKFGFMLDGNSDVPVVYSIGGIPNDAEKGMFWTLHLASNSNRVKGDAGRLSPFSGNIKQLIPHAGDEFIFWMKSL